MPDGARRRRHAGDGRNAFGLTPLHRSARETPGDPAGAAHRRGHGYGRACKYPRHVPDVSDHDHELDGLPVFWRSAPAQAEGVALPLYLHGVPSNSDEWVPFLERTGGVAPDLPGFGRSGKAGYLQFTIDEYVGFIERFLAWRELERVSIVVHDWGAVGLAFAQRHPERVGRIVIINAVPLLPGYRWHRTARMWRTPLLGELVMGATGRVTLRQGSKQMNATPGPMPQAWLDSVLEHFDHGTQRAILRLYRSSPPEVLASAGARLGELQVPALVVWGMRDPYIPPRFGQAYAATLADAQLIQLPDAGHVPWLDRPDVLDTVAGFLGAAAE